MVFLIPFAVVSRTLQSNLDPFELYDDARLRDGIVDVSGLFCGLSFLRDVQHSWAGETRGDRGVGKGCVLTCGHWHGDV